MEIKVNLRETTYKLYKKILEKCKFKNNNQAINFFIKYFYEWEIKEKDKLKNNISEYKNILIFYVKHTI